jgi:hydroxyacid-oxoacid transhydrogenase
MTYQHDSIEHDTAFQMSASNLRFDTNGIDPIDPQDAGEILAGRIIHFMRRLDMPNGLSAVGYNEADIPTLVAGTLPQHRVTKLSPRPAGPDDLATLFRESMRIW